jgi:histidine triad (HIT) family protein
MLGIVRALWKCMDTQKTGHTAPCTFCELIQGSAEVSICHEDSDAIAFMDIQPVNDGHVLVVPREHHESLLDVPEELGVHLFKVTMRIANAIREVTGCEDMNIVVNSGAAAGQDEPHYHVHIIPRVAGDGFDIPLPFDGSKMPDRTVLDANAARIIAALRDPMRVHGSGQRGGRQPTAEQRNAPQAGASSAAPTNARRTSSATRSERIAERTVDVRVFNESSTAPHGSSAAHAMRRGTPLRADEGAHGELLHELSFEAGAS